MAFDATPVSLDGGGGEMLEQRLLVGRRKPLLHRLDGHYVGKIAHHCTRMGRSAPERVLVGKGR
jgi:hypothetical protein